MIMYISMIIINTIFLRLAAFAALAACCFASLRPADRLAALLPSGSKLKGKDSRGTGIAKLLLVGKSATYR